MFIERINNVTGQREWVVAEENYDLAQEIARSAFADMLLDEDRNQRYKHALETVIKEKKQLEEYVHVVDIGTGTGLLSLMAAKAGANKVTAIEVFPPMAKMASEIFSSSKFKDIIDLISSRSTDLKHSSLTEIGNLIVAEVFDTELIGEGALRTFKEAHDTIVKKGSRVIPSKARIWILPAESSFLAKFNKTPSKILKNPFEGCPGAAAVFDIQMSVLSPDQFNALGKPFVAFDFDFEHPDSIHYNEWKVRDFVVSNTTNSSMNVVFMWWDLDMDGSGENILSMAPTWFNSNSIWRDHWLQAVYFLPKSRKVTKYEHIQIGCAHDEYSLWFSIQNSNNDPIEKPICNCQIHAICARNSIYRMNELEENVAFMKLLQTSCKDKMIVCVNEGSLLGLYAAKFASKVTIVDSNLHFRMILEKYKQYNKITNVVIVESVDEIEEAPSIILSEPFYLSSLSPWNNLRFWFDVERIRNKFPSNQFHVFPKNGFLYAMPVAFEHLWKIVSKVGVVEGHDLSKFDEFCEKARSATDPQVEPQPLWEYKSTCTGEQKEVARFDFTKRLLVNDNQFDATIQISKHKTNAITLWMDWHFTDDLVLSTGVQKTCIVGDYPSWNPGYRQGVHFLESSIQDTPHLKIRTEFAINDGEIIFQFAH